MHNVDFKSDLYLATFSVHCPLKSHVYHLCTQISNKYHIYAQCRLEEWPINPILYLNLPCLVNGFHINTIFMHNVDFKSDW